MITPGTRLTWTDLAGWCAAAETLEARDLFHGCKRTSDAMKAHWQALPEDWIKTATPEACAALLALLQQRPVRSPWECPRRGRRAGKWERVNVEARNALQRAARAADRAAMGLGHNSQRAAQLDGLT